MKNMKICSENVFGIPNEEFEFLREYGLPRNALFDCPKDLMGGIMSFDSLSHPRLLEPEELDTPFSSDMLNYGEFIIIGTYGDDFICYSKKDDWSLFLVRTCGPRYKSERPVTFAIDSLRFLNSSAHNFILCRDIFSKYLGMNWLECGKNEIENLKNNIIKFVPDIFSRERSYWKTIYDEDLDVF